jgi:hypothetical protein
MSQDKEIKPKAMNKTTLARLYNVHIDTFTKWIEPFADKIGTVTGRIFTPKQVETIFECLGEP